MSNYFFSKISNINYNISIHEGNAIKRLASQSPLIIVQLSPSACPEKFKEKLIELRKIISDHLKNRSTPGLTPTKLGNMRNKTASEFIKLLIDIEEYLEHEEPEF